jgi:hypothetical protein
VLAALLLASAPAAAQSSAFDPPLPDRLGPWGVLLSVNLDDDDENGRRDHRQSPPPAEDDDVKRVRLRPPARTAAATFEGEGLERIRLHLDGVPVTPFEPAPISADSRLVVDGVRASAATGDVRLRASYRDAEGAEIGRWEATFTVVGIVFLDAANGTLDPARDALQISNRVTHDESLPRENEPGTVSPDPDNTRIECFADPVPGSEAGMRARSPREGRVRSALAPLPLAGPSGAAGRSPFIRLAADTMDWTAAGVTRQVLRADLRDRVTAFLRAPDGQEAGTDLRVGRPGNEDGPTAVRRGRWVIHFVRLAPGGPPAVGVEEGEARRIAADQIRAANEVYASCNITFGDPGDTPVFFPDPPGPTLLAVADGDGLTSAGGRIRFAVNGTPIGPIVVGRDWAPHRTAAALALAVEAAGFRAEASENAKLAHAAGRSADVLIRDARGNPVRIEPLRGEPITTDRRQTLTIGAVDLTDDLTPFDNSTAAAGTLEERTLIKTLWDGDPTTIDLFVINRFASGARQGEAFIENSRGMVRNAFLLDRTGIRQTRQAWTQAHEAGHVLLDDPYHPDNFGPDRPWMLMDADASWGAVGGPKRLTEEECDRIRRESGIDAVPALLRRWDEVPAERREPPEDLPLDPGYPRP